MSLSTSELQTLQRAAECRVDSEFYTICYTTPIPGPGRRRLGDPEVDRLVELDLLEDAGANAAMSVWRYRITLAGIRHLDEQGLLPVGLKHLARGQGEG